MQRIWKGWKEVGIKKAPYVRELSSRARLRE